MSTVVRLISERRAYQSLLIRVGGGDRTSFQDILRSICESRLVNVKRLAGSERGFAEKQLKTLTY